MTMRVTSLEIDQVLGVKLSISGLDDVVKLVGKNGAGKSRIMTGLLAALKYDSLPINKRKALLATDGTIAVEIEDGDIEKDGWIVTRTVKDGKTALKVRAKDSRIKGTQSLLDDFIGDNFVDLGRFLTLPEDKKRDAVLTMLGLAEPLEELEQKRKEVYERRHGIGRDRQGLGLPDEEPAKTDRVSVSELSKKLQDAIAHNAEIDDTENSISYATNNLGKAVERIEELQVKAKDLKAEIIAAQETLKDMERIDADAITAEMEAAEETNEAAEEHERYCRLKEQYDGFCDDYKRLSGDLITIDGMKAELIESKEFPVEGLSYDERGLTYKGHTFISDGEYRKVAFQVAKALKGDLSIATFENFSLLDPEAQAEVVRDAHDAGFQVFIEIVAGSAEGQDGFYIEDGELKE